MLLKTMSFNIFLCRLILTIFIFSTPFTMTGCSSTQNDNGLPINTSRKQLLSLNWVFELQPFRESRIFINGILQKPKVIKRDKSRARLLMDVPLYKDRYGFEIKIRNNGYGEIRRVVALQGADREWKDTPPFFNLNRKGSLHRLAYTWKTGRRPKSVTFLDERRVVVPLLEDRGVDIINIETGQTTRIQPPKKWSKDIGFVETMVLEKYNELWISQMVPNRIHIFNLNSLIYKQTIQIKGHRGKVMVFDPVRNRVYYTNWDSRDISVINPATKEQLFKIKPQGVPRNLCLTDDYKYLYVAQFGHKHDKDWSGSVAKISLDTMQLVRKIGSHGCKRHIVKITDKNLLFVSDMLRTTVDVYDMRTDRMINSIRVYSHPNTIVLSLDKRLLYVSCRGKNNPVDYRLKSNDMGRIYVIDTETQKVVEYWEGGNQPTGLALSPDGKYLVSSNFLDNEIRVYEITRSKEMMASK